MAEKKPNDPADTQMFRAFVQRGEPEAPPRRMLPILAVLAAVLAVAVGIWLALA